MPFDKGHLALLTDLRELVSLTQAMEFHDFENTNFATPKIELRNRLLGMAENVVEGKYDN